MAMGRRASRTPDAAVATAGGPRGDPDHLERLRVAQLLVREGRRVVGLLAVPAGRARGADTWSLARSLGEALGEVAPEPVSVLDGGASPLGELHAGIDRARREVTRLLVVLDPLRARGEHLGVAAHLDGVVLVVAADRTREDELVHAAAALAPARCLGVLLVGGLR